VFAKFRGGKGIATLIGVVSAMDYKLAFLCFAIFFLVVVFTRFISLGSMISAMLSPVIVYLLHGNRHPSFIYFCIAIGAAVLYTHRSNIGRLAAGTENRFSFTKKGIDPPVAGTENNN
jgi:glycerol-3-phosphate acyltransferase PlsY